MLDVFNNIPGIRTTFCCCGHRESGWYISFKCTSNFVFNLIEEYFSNYRGLKFEVRTDILDDGYDKVPEKQISIYCDELGMMKDNRRRMEYKKICEYFSLYTPHEHWIKIYQF